MKPSFIMKSHLAKALLLATMLTGCSTGSDPETDTPQPQPGQPSSTKASLLVYGKIQDNTIIPTSTTRAGWNSDYKIGIYQVNIVQERPTVSTLINNRQYVIATPTTEGKFEPADDSQAITLEQTTTLNAYAPYTQSLMNNIYAISLTDQTNPGSIDLMTAKATAAVSSGVKVTTAQFNFEHRLCKIEVTLLNEINMEGFIQEQVEASMSNQHVQGTYNLASGAVNATGEANATIKMFVPQDDNPEDNKIKAEAIVMPVSAENASASRTMVFRINGKEFSYDIPKSHVYKAGTKVTYDIRITPKELVVKATVTDWETDTVINPNGNPVPGEAYPAN